MSDLGKAYVQIVPSAQGISGSISQILGSEATSAGEKAGLNIAGGIGSALKGATTVIAAGTAAVSTALVKGAGDVASYGDNIDKMSQKMGISAQGYQEWEAVMQHSGTSMETMKSSMKTLANAVEKGNDAFGRIGLSMDEIGKMSNEEIFAATIAGLQKVDNETERTYLAGQLLGKGATELGALLNTSAEDTQAMRDRVRELGGVMSDDAIKASAQFQDNMQDLQTAVSGVGRNMMSELLPSMNEIIAGFASLVIGEEGAVEKLSSGFESLFGKVGEIGEKIVGKITEMMPTIIEGISKILPDIIKMAASLITSFAQALVEQMPTLLTTVIPALLEAAINLVIAFGEAIVNAAPQLLDAAMQLMEMLTSSFDGSEMLEKGSELIQNMLDGITEKLPDLLNKGVEMLTNLINGIMESAPKLIETAGTLITKFVEFVMQNYPKILKAGADLLLNMVNGIVNNLPKIVDSVVKVITQFISTLTQNLPKILQQGIEIIAKLTVGLINAIPKLVAAIPQIIAAIVKAFASMDWGKIGIDLISGIAKGIGDAVSMIVEAAVDAAKAAFNAAKQWLGISSPSKKGMFIGQMFDDGVALGVEKNSSKVEDAMTDLSESATSQLQTSLTSDFNVSTNGASDSKMDLLLEMLANYLPEIAENKGITTEALYSGLNRQLGAALT